MTNKVEVLDRCMGSGKTTQCFKWMSQHINERYIYISPLLSECEQRVSVDAIDLEFRNPESPNKGRHMLELLKEGANISTTHALFSDMTKEHLAEVESKGYIIIIDEEFGMIEPMPNEYKQSDVEFLLDKKLITINEDKQGIVTWLEGDETKHDSKYGKFKAMCDIGMLFAAKRKDKAGVNKFMVTQLPLELITKAKRVVILTYLFDGSIMDAFLKLKGIDVQPFTDYDVKDKHPSEYKPLINFVGMAQRKKLSTLPLSATGYEERLTQIECDNISKAIKAIGKATNNTAMELVYSVPKKLVKPDKRNAKRINPPSYAPFPKSVDESNLIDIDGETYAKGCWLYSEARATNLYRNRKTMIYCIDKYPLQSVKAYLQDYGQDVDNDKYALSCLLQWLWRGCIRTGKPMNVCCISTKDRMHKLLDSWLNCEA